MAMKSSRQKIHGKHAEPSRADTTPPPKMKSTYSTNINPRCS
jgi:hypothetical protein